MEKNDELAIVKYIKTNGLAKAIDEFKIKVTVYENKVLLKYSQLESPKCVETNECRGLILERDTWKVMSYGFYRFFNSGETNAAKINWDLARVLEKADGCCHANTILITEDGEKTIQDICENKYRGKVLAYDVNTNNEVFDEVVAHSILENNSDWYEIILENGGTIKLTGNHLVWLPELNCYRRVDELNEGDEVLLKKVD